MRINLNIQDVSVKLMSRPMHIYNFKILKSQNQGNNPYKIKNGGTELLGHLIILLLFMENTDSNFCFTSSKINYYSPLYINLFVHLSIHPFTISIL